MTLTAQLVRPRRDQEMSEAVRDLAGVAQFLMQHRSFSNATAMVEREGSRAGNLGPRLAAIVASGIDGISIAQLTKAAQSPMGLSGSALSDYSGISAGFLSSLTT